MLLASAAIAKPDDEMNPATTDRGSTYRTYLMTLAAPPAGRDGRDGRAAAPGMTD